MHFAYRCSSPAGCRLDTCGRTGKVPKQDAARLEISGSDLVTSNHVYVLSETRAYARREGVHVSSRGSSFFEKGGTSSTTAGEKAKAQSGGSSTSERGLAVPSQRRLSRRDSSEGSQPEQEWQACLRGGKKVSAWTCNPSRGDCSATTVARPA